MKRFVPTLFAVLSFVVISCGGGKSGDPTPITTTTTTGISGGTTTGTTTGGTTGTTTTTSTHTNIFINTRTGNFAVAADNSLISINLSDNANSKAFNTALGNTVGITVKTSLEHSEDAILDKATGSWRAKWTNNSTTDTIQPYVRTIVTDANKNVIEYRAYIDETTGALALFQTNVPSVMDIATFNKILATQNTQKVTVAQQ